VRPGATTYGWEDRTFLAALRHDALFELLSALWVHPISRGQVYHRGIIPEDDPTIFRKAASLDALDENTAGGLDWHATDKHRVALVIQTSVLREGGSGGLAGAAPIRRDLWDTGVLLFVVSAPLSQGGKWWRITLAPASPITGDVFLVGLQWVGNRFEALRRAAADADFAAALVTFAEAPPGSAGTNILKGRVPEAVLEDYARDGDIPLDMEQRSALQTINSTTNPLIVVKALTGVGKTAIAHCLLKAFVAAHPDDAPGDRNLALFAVLTRELRDEVVLDLLRSKAVKEHQVLWLGRPSGVQTLLADMDTHLAQKVKDRQQPAYVRLAELEATMGTLAGLLRDTADRLAEQDRLTILCQLKDAAAEHIRMEVVDIDGTYDCHMCDVLKPIRVVVATFDASTKLLPGPGLSRVKNLNARLAFAILDEAQRADLFIGAALLAHVQTAVVLCDQTRTYANRNPWHPGPR
jgi:hypothetical protein